MGGEEGGQVAVKKDEREGEWRWRRKEERKG